MKKSIRSAVTIAAAGIAGFALVTAGVTPAAAVGFSNPSYYAESGSTGARSVEQKNVDCGTMGARAGYRAYPGSPIYQTGWAYHSTDARVTQSTTVTGYHFNGSNGRTVTT